jgi:predicted RNase H-like HicB family nuclease
MASCPSLPGCYVTATTRSEARREIRRAMIGYVNRLDETLPRELGRLLHSGGTC